MLNNDPSVNVSQAQEATAKCSSGFIVELGAFTIAKHTK